MGVAIAVKGAGGLDVIASIVPKETMTVSAAVVAIVGSFAGGQRHNQILPVMLKMQRLLGEERYSDI